MLRTLKATVAAIALALILTAPPIPAWSATISVFEQQGITFVGIQGTFVKGDASAFTTKTAPLSKAVVLFESDGGAVVEGIIIGETLRLKNFDTLVPANVRCASACALAWLGGRRRFMGANAQIGFHAAYDASTGQETGVANALVGAYLTRIGLPISAVIYITQAHPTSMTWLSISGAKAKGIEVSLLDSPSEKRPATNTQPPYPSEHGPPTTADDASRKALQGLLVWSGKYSGPIDGEIGPGTRRAISAFQQSVGEIPTGVLSPRAFNLLAKTAMQKAASVGFEMRTDARTRITVGIPTKYVSAETPTRLGTRLSARDGSVAIEFFALSAENRDFSALFEKMKNSVTTRLITYQTFHQNWFAFSGWDDPNTVGQRHFYARVHTNGVEYRGFSISIEGSLEPTLRETIAMMSFSFDPFGKLPPPPAVGGPYVPSVSSTVR